MFCSLPPAIHNPVVVIWDASPQVHQALWSYSVFSTEPCCASITTGTGGFISFFGISIPSPLLRSPLSLFAWFLSYLSSLLSLLLFYSSSLFSLVFMPCRLLPFELHSQYCTGDLITSLPLSTYLYHPFSVFFLLHPVWMRSGTFWSNIWNTVTVNRYRYL